MTAGRGGGARPQDADGPQVERRDGDGRACEDLEALYRAESPKLLRLIARRTRSRDEAQEIVQDAFLRLASLRGRVPMVLLQPQAYLRRIADNLLKDRAKSAARRSAALHVVGGEETLVAPDPSRHLEARDMLRQLEAAIMRLRPRTREIFLAHRVEGFTYAEIARRTGLSVKGVEKQMSKALLQMDRFLDGR